VCAAAGSPSTSSSLGVTAGEAASVRADWVSQAHQTLADTADSDARFSADIARRSSELSAIDSRSDVLFAAEDALHKARAAATHAAAVGGAATPRTEARTEVQRIEGLTGAAPSVSGIPNDLLQPLPAEGAASGSVRRLGPLVEIASQRPVHSAACSQSLSSLAPASLLTGLSAALLVRLLRR
jgi:hypothetical protein